MHVSQSHGLGEWLFLTNCVDASQYKLDLVIGLSSANLEDRHVLELVCLPRKPKAREEAEQEAGWVLRGEEVKGGREHITWR